MRGRKPTSTQQKELTGNPGHRAMNRQEPKYETASDAFDEPPQELVGHDVAVAEWRRLVPQLRRTGHIVEVDRGALVALCLEWSRYLDATKKVDSLGMVVKAPSGYPMVNPYLSIATKALAACNKLWPELGLTPSSRSRVMAVNPAAAGDAFAEFDQPPRVNVH